MSDNQTSATSITRDPVYYITAAFFAVLTTALPAGLGQPRFLPILQTVTLTTFVAVTLYNRHPRGALRVLAIWLPIQFIVMTLMSTLLPAQIEDAFTAGFAYRGAITAWFFGGAPYPNGLSSQPVPYFIEVIAVFIGSLFTAGLVGIWFLVRMVNLAAFGTGILLETLANPAQSLLVIPYWTLLRATGYSGVIVLCAMPLSTYNWSPAYYWHQHKRLILISIGLIILAIVVELMLPGIVARPPLN